MKQILILLVILCEIILADNACRQPYKFNAGVTPFYANRIKIDSMHDATGYMASYEYDEYNRVIKNGSTSYKYITNFRYSSYDSIKGLSIEYFDNENIGIDSVLFIRNDSIIWKNYFRFNSEYSVFENWQTLYDIKPTTYDSIAFIEPDSLYHYNMKYRNGNTYEYIETCKSYVDTCKCFEVNKTVLYPYYMVDDPIYIYKNGLLKNMKWGTIYYSENGSSSSSSSGTSSSSNGQTLSVNIQTHSESNMHRNGYILLNGQKTNKTNANAIYIKATKPNNR